VLACVGVTATVPPVLASVTLVLSLPATVTAVAFDAFTVRVEEFPGVTLVGLAEMLTVVAFAACTVRFTVSVVAPPHLSHSSTTVCCDPVARVIDVFSFAPLTT
jgi:hypothetical protein